MARSILPLILLLPQLAVAQSSGAAPLEPATKPQASSSEGAASEEIPAAAEAAAPPSTGPLEAAPPEPAAPPAEAAEPPPPTSKLRIAIMDLTPAAGVSEDAAVSVTGLIAARVDGLRVFDLVTEEDVRNLVNFDELRTVLSEADDASKLAEIGETLGADYLLSGRVYAEPRVDIVLYDLKTQKAVRREVAQARSRAALTRPLLRGVDRVIAPVLASRTAKLIVRASEEGATLALDGDALGPTPLPVREVGSGPHTLTATKDGFLKTEIDLVLQPGQSVPVDVVLIPSKELIEQHEKDAWLWRGTAIGLLGGAAAAVIGGGALLVVNQLRTEQLAADTGQGSATVLQLRPAEYGELQLYRIGGGILLGGAAPLLAAGGAFAWFAGPEPGKYAELTE